MVKMSRLPDSIATWGLKSPLNQHIETNRLKAVGAITKAYLEAIMPTRLQILQSLRQAWPPRVNARMGTTVLQNGIELTRPDGSEPQEVLVGRNPTYPELRSSP
jgi:hypothetical protein